jgi:hypothetical protein
MRQRHARCGRHAAHDKEHRGASTLLAYHDATRSAVRRLGAPMVTVPVASASATWAHKARAATGGAGQ